MRVASRMWLWAPP